MPKELPKLKLPKAVEADSRYPALIDLLDRDCQLVWEKSAIAIPHVSFTPSLGVALGAALSRQQLMLGLEKIDRTLDIEKKGLDAVREKKAEVPPLRVSRLLIVTSDGSERFYRACERTALKHGDRLLVIRANIPSEDLAVALHREGREIKALLVSDKVAVSSVLLSLIQD